MAEYLSNEEVRNYPLSNGETADLIALVGMGDLSRLVRSNGSLTIGAVAYVFAMGHLRRGVVTKVTKAKTFVTFTTQGAVTDALNPTGWGRGVRVQTTGDPHSWILVDEGDVHALALAEDTERADEGRSSLGSIEDMHAEALEMDAERDQLAQLKNWRWPHLARGHGSDQNMIDADYAEALTEAPNLIAQGQDTEMHDASTQDHTGSAVVRTLEKVWARIREDHPELPEVVIVTGSGMVGASKWGHFRADGWTTREGLSGTRKHELFLAGEALAKGARQVLQTMLHEGAHTLARVRNLQDTSRQGRWHNGTFRKLAEEMGLEHKGTTADKSLGWSCVTLKQDTADRYADLMAELETEIRLTCHLPGWLDGTGGEADKGGERIGVAPKGQGETKPQSGPLRAECACAEPNIIRTSRKVLDMGVRCDQCESLFTV